LAESCLGQVTTAGESTCPAGQSCQPATGTCGSNVIDPTTLPPYGGPGAVNEVDASVGAFASDSGTSEEDTSTADANDANVPDANDANVPDANDANVPD